MRNLKSVVIVFLFLVFSISFYSCSDNDGYSLGDMWGGIATVEKIDNSTFSLTIGEGTSLWVAATNRPNFRPSQRRALINYTILGENESGYIIKLNDIKDILTKDVKPITEEGLSEVANDPIKLGANTISGGFLNLRIAYPFGGDAKHEVNLYKVENTDEVAEDRVVDLEFRHDKKGDKDSWWQESRICFDLHSLQIPGKDSVKLRIKLNTDKGSETVELEYNY